MIPLVGFGVNFDRRWHHSIDVAGPADDIQGWGGGMPRGLNAVPGTAGPLRVEIGFVDGTALTLGLDG